MLLDSIETPAPPVWRQRLKRWAQDAGVILVKTFGVCIALAMAHDNLDHGRLPLVASWLLIWFLTVVPNRWEP